jgi:hypothetical protein
MNDVSTNIVISLHGDSDFVKGKKQWEILKQLNEKYKKVDISSVTSNKFDDPVWSMSESNVNVSIQFNKYLVDSTDLPLQVYLKILSIHLIKTGGLSQSSLATGLSGFLSGFVLFLKQMKTPILSASKNAPWLPLSIIEPSDISHSLDRVILERKSIKPILDTLSWIEKTQHFADFAVFGIGFITPWTYENLSLDAWLKGFYMRHDIHKERKPYSPLTDETVSKVITPAIAFLKGISTNFQDNISLKPKDMELPIIKILGCIKRIKYDSNITHTNLPAHISNNEEFSELIRKHSALLKILGHPIESFITPREESYYRGTIEATWFTTLFKLSQQAAIWIVAITTGLRNSDIRNLKTDCLHYSKNFQVWFVKADIQKTNNTIYIPVGEATVQAVKLLNWLRFSSSSDYLIQVNVFSFEYTSEDIKNYRIRSGDTINRRLRAFCAHYDVSMETIDDNDDEGTCHCIRATLAGFIGKHSVLAILILKKLFGHSNRLMPDQYLRHNVFVQQKRQEQVNSMQSEISYQIAKSIVCKEVAGKKGEELLKGALHLTEKIMLENKSLNETDVHKKLTEVLQEIILNDIVNEQTQTLLTPMAVICMRATNHSSDSPCAANSNKQERDKAGVSRAMFSAMAQLPNPARCVGIDCPDALATKTHSLPLLEQFDWYTNTLRYCTDNNRDMNEDANHFVGVYYPIIKSNDMLKEAESFRKKYGPVLRQLYADLKPESYFDA